jgi:hypothetical protein
MCDHFEVGFGKYRLTPIRFKFNSYQTHHKLVNYRRNKTTSIHLKYCLKSLILGGTCFTTTSHTSQGIHVDFSSMIISMGI